MDTNVTAEFWKAQIGFYKHLATLSTGSIVLIATFLQRPYPSSWIIFSLIGFVVCVLASVSAYALIVEFQMPGAKQPVPNLKWLAWITVIFTWLGFLIGAIGLAAFAIQHLTR
jgi:hypothetical protein